MRRPRRFLVADIAVVLLVAVVTVALGLSSGSSEPEAAALTVDSSATGQPIPRDFLGLSFEYNAIPAYAGDDPLAVNPVFLQLIRNVAPGRPPALRIGGDTTDWTWWPVPGLARPPGVTYTLTHTWLAVTHALAAALRARLILGINLEADSQAIAGAEARALLSAIGRSSIEALELGNEPELYDVFTWYRNRGGRSVKGRGPGYDFQAYVRDFTRIAAALPSVPLAGPALNVSGWITHLGQFLAAEPRVKVVTVHKYPLQLCFVARSSPKYPTVSDLLAGSASAGLAKLLAPSIATAHARGLPLLLDELNTVACGADAAVSRTFASALWSLDILFELAHAGVDGVYFHTFPTAGYNLFSFTRVDGRWRASVAPEYYGLLTFAEAAPLGAKLVPTSGDQPAWLRKWATRSRAGTIRVVLINVGDRAHTVSISLPGSGHQAKVVRLLAPGVRASTGITLAGRTLGPVTETGRLGGTYAPIHVPLSAGRYVVQMPAYSAALITIR